MRLEAMRLEAMRLEAMRLEAMRLEAMRLDVGEYSSADWRVASVTRPHYSHMLAIHGRDGTQ